MWQDSLKPALRRWMVGTLIALAYAAMTGSCTPQPAANRVLVQTEPATERMAALQQQADQEAAQWEAAYSRMSDQERMRGIVYEPIPDRLPETDDATRLQYLALALESVTGGFKKPINWKTMDNSFLMLTPELLREIMQAMHDDEEADFINAEKHKAAMLKAEHPLEYDYSAGWTANFDEQPAAELEEA